MPTLTGPTIFVVNDEEVISKTLEVILNGSGFYAKSFTSPLRVLEEVKTTTPEHRICLYRMS